MTESLDNVEQLNTWVANFASALNLPIDTSINRMFVNITIPTPTLGRLFGPLRNAQIMHASGNRMDCLIHSFLSCCSQNFRRLDDFGKDTVADSFRRVILVDYVDQGLIKYSKNTLSGNRFLDDDFGKQLACKFSVNILFLTKPGLIRGQAPGAMLKKCAGANDDTPTIVIHGDNTHFTPVKISDPNNYFTTDFDAEIAVSTALGIIQPEATPRATTNNKPVNNNANNKSAKGGRKTRRSTRRARRGTRRS